MYFPKKLHLASLQNFLDTPLIVFRDRIYTKYIKYSILLIIMYT